MQNEDPFQPDPAVRLVFTSDEMPGYRRMRRGRGFAYRLPDGALLKNRRERRRIKSLAIPPAYESVWICRLANGHLQATGVDARGRKQYVYHPAWQEISAERKFAQLPAFAASLPRIRAAYRKALRSGDSSRRAQLCWAEAGLHPGRFRALAGPCAVVREEFSIPRTRREK